MSTLTGRPPAGADHTPQEAPPAPAAGVEQRAQPAVEPQPSARACERCGAALAGGQDWCLSCGAGAPGSLAPSSWRAGAGIAAGIAALAIGAVAAAYAAFDQHAPARRVVTVAAAPASLAPSAAKPSTATKAAPPATPAPGTPTKPVIPLQKAKLPKIPATAPTPAASSSTPTGRGEGSTETSGGGSAAHRGGNSNSTSTGSTGTGTGSTGTGTGAGQEAAETEPSALVLDTDAASTYNPYDLPASDFGDPSLTIDGDNSTSWTALVDPASAPKMAVGVLLDLVTPHRLAKIAIVSPSRGMAVQVYGSNAAKPPDTITSHKWVPLTGQLTVVRRTMRVKLLKLRHQQRGFRWVTLWISRAPASAAGTPEAPRQVEVSEIELFPPR